MPEDVVKREFDKEELSVMKNFFKKVGNFFSNLFSNKEKIKTALDAAFDLGAQALPFIDMAASIAAGVTPTKVDDIALAAIRKAYPRLFDGSIVTGPELRLYTLGVATELVKSKYPEVSTTVARLAVQTAYTLKKEGESSDK